MSSSDPNPSRATLRVLARTPDTAPAGQSLGALTWPEAGRRADAGAVLAIPVGSTEQHGPHLPLSTDADVAAELCRRLAAARTDVLVAPPLGYGSSGEHQHFAGTLSIGADALGLVLLELGRSATETFRRVLLVNGHGGNVEPAARAVERLRYEARDVRLFTPSNAGDAHAGRSETSMQLAMQPAAVRTERAEPGDVRPVADLLPLLRSGGVRAVSPNGILGDPTAATARHGHDLLDALAADLLTRAAAWFPPLALDAAAGAAR